MLYPLIALLALKVTAVKVMFMPEADSRRICVVSQLTSSSFQLPKLNSCTIDVAPHTSMLVDSHIEKYSSNEHTVSFKELPMLVLLDCSVAWTAVASILRVLGDPCETRTFGPEVGSWDDVIAVCRSLQICDMAIVSRLWEAVCASPQFQDMLSDPVARLRHWAELFCDTSMLGSMPVPDGHWLDIIKAVCNAKQDWAEHVNFKDFIEVELHKTPEWLDKKASPLIQAILQFVIDKAHGLIVPHTLFLKYAPLAGRFGDIVDIIQAASDRCCLLLSGIAPTVIRKPTDLQKACAIHADRQAPICLLRGKSIAVCECHRGATSPRVLEEVLVELLPGRITHLLLDVPDAKETFWAQPISDTKSVLTAVAAQPLETLAIHCRHYTPMFVRSLVESMPKLQRLVTILDWDVIGSDWSWPPCSLKHFVRVCGFYNCLARSKASAMDIGTASIVLSKVLNNAC